MMGMYTPSSSAIANGALELCELWHWTVLLAAANVLLVLITRIAPNYLRHWTVLLAALNALMVLITMIAPNYMHRERGYLYAQEDKEGRMRRRGRRSGRRRRRAGRTRRSVARGVMWRRWKLRGGRAARRREAGCRERAAEEVVMVAQRLSKVKFILEHKAVTAHRGAVLT
jgi:hypothetical protein